MLRHVTAIRYATPLREGGSLPGLMEGDDLGTWVVKFTGAGQGPKALVAEVIVGELARELGFAVPELVRMDVDPELGRTEPDQEVQDLLRASAGVNLGMDYLPGSLTYDPLAFALDPELAARLLWLDALTLNVDRSWRNPNLLVWGARLWLIDHGAALYPHHDWTTAAGAVDRVLPGLADHVVLPVVAAVPATVAAADARLAPRIDRDLLSAVVDRVPAAWLDASPAAYVDWLLARAGGQRPWVEAINAALAAAAGPASGAARGRPDPGRDPETGGERRGSGRPDWLRAGDWLRTGGATGGEGRGA